MLKHRFIAPLFILFLISLIVLDTRMDIPFWIYFLGVVVFLSLEFYGAYFIHSDFHLAAVCSINTQDKVVALTFDDGPVQQTEKVLSVLDSFNTKATFFCIGARVQGNEAVLKRIDAEGHLIGNHSYSHTVLFDFKNASAFIKDIEQANKKIELAIGKSPAYFRPPYGVTTPSLARAVRKLGCEVIGWNVRSLDTSLKDGKKVLLRIKKRLKPGSIILMHDTVEGIELTVKDLLIYLHEKNYKVVGLDTLIQKKAYV